MPGALHSPELDQRWISENARIHVLACNSPNRRSCAAQNWIRAGIVTALAFVLLAAFTAAALACEAESTPSPCVVSVARTQTDQFMDPWSDLGLSMDPATRDRSGYAGGNPVGNVDTDGHRFTDGDGHESLPTAHGIYHMESNSSTYS
jgi:hypothetical protein